MMAIGDGGYVLQRQAKISSARSRYGEILDLLTTINVKPDYMGIIKEWVVVVRVQVCSMASFNHACLSRRTSQII